MAALPDTVTVVGPYGPNEVAALMSAIDWVVVPSIWWENSPLVIQEAFQHGRPVICSGIGGMAEKIGHGITGLHFRAADPASLADTIHQAMSSGRLWKKLHDNIAPVYPMRDHVATLSGLYRKILARQRPGRA